MASYENDDRNSLIASIGVLATSVGVLLTAVSIVVAVTVPEVRALLHLDPPKDRTKIEAEKRALDDAVRALDREKERGAEARQKLEDAR